MKATTVFVLILLIPIEFFSQVSQEWVMETIQKYSPTTYYIVNQFKTNGNSISVGGRTVSSTMSHLKHNDLNSKESFLNTIGITVHETTHAFDSQIPYMIANKNNQPLLNNHEGFFLDESTQIAYQFPINKLFASEDLSKVIPKNLRTFRYNTYIESDSYSQSTQSDGVIGLMEEFNAYYHGSKVIFDLLPIYKEVFGSNFLGKWSFAFTSQGDAFYEFDFFIKEYLLYAKSHNQALYIELKNDQNFKSIYQAIRTRYSNLISMYEKKYDEFTLVAQKQNGILFSTEKHTNLIFPVLSEQIKSNRYSDIENDFLKK
jgi:hypothetical protein